VLDPASPVDRIALAARSVSPVQDALDEQALLDAAATDRSHRPAGGRVAAARPPDQHSEPAPATTPTTSGASAPVVPVEVPVARIDARDAGAVTAPVTGADIVAAAAVARAQVMFELEQQTPLPAPPTPPVPIASPRAQPTAHPRRTPDRGQRR
jgi:hypothetical protein